jgi:hypothetical protein
MNSNARFEVSTAVKIQIKFWVVTRQQRPLRVTTRKTSTEYYHNANLVGVSLFFRSASHVFYCYY